MHNTLLTYFLLGFSLLFLSPSEWKADTKNINQDNMSNWVVEAPDACVTTYLSDLDWDSATNGLNNAFSIGVNQSTDGDSLRINGQTYDYGLGTHAPSTIIYNLDGGYDTFRTFIGVDDEEDDCGAEASVIFKVFTDGVEVYTSPQMGVVDDAIAVTIPLIGVNELKLEVDMANGQDYCDHADWADAKLETCDDGCDLTDTPCNDGDPCTTGDKYDTSCNCVGDFYDDDGDGIANICDQCEGQDDNADSDGDGVADGCDQCPGHNDNVDSDGDGIADGCEVNNPLCETTYLSDLDWDSATNGLNNAFSIGINQSTDGDSLRINGQTYDYGLGTHAPSTIIYNLGGGYDTFRTFIGVDDEEEDCGAEASVIFKVFTDGVEVYTSPQMGVVDDAIAVTIPLSGVNELKLEVDMANGQDYCDHADWADAKLEVCDDGCDLTDTPCNDGDPCTTGDKYDASCNCVGDFYDDDGDGIANVCDQCEGQDDNADSDGDGVADGCDQCPNHDDTIDSDGDGIADGCDQCVGHDDSQDGDGDGVADGCDQCPNHDDTIDSDGDGIADGCEVNNPLCETTYLSDLDWDSATNGLNNAFSIGINQSTDGDSLRINGQTYDYGLGTHAPSTIIYNLGGGYDTFRTFIGVDDEEDDCGAEASVIFKVFTDGVEVYTSPQMGVVDDAIAVTIPLSGVNELKLEVDMANGQDYCDHADWADAKLEFCDDIICELEGTSCDDGNEATINDTYDAQCNCIGTTAVGDCNIPELNERSLDQSFSPGDIIFIGFDNDIGGERDRLIMTNLVPLYPGTQFTLANTNYCAETNAWYSRDGQTGNIAAQTITYNGEGGLPAGNIICVDVPSAGSVSLLLENFMLNGSPTAVFSVQNVGRADNADINLLTTKANGLFLMQGNWSFSADHAKFAGHVMGALRIGDTNAWAGGSCSTGTDLPPGLECPKGPDIPLTGSSFAYFDCSQFGNTFNQFSYLTDGNDPINWTQGTGTAGLDLPGNACTPACSITCEETYWSIVPGTLTVSCGTDYEAIIQDWLGRNGDGAFESDCPSGVDISDNYVPGSIVFANNPSQYPVIFKAKDGCGNMESVTGYIILEGIGVPTFDPVPQSIEVSCENKDEELENWMNNYAGAQASDNCGALAIHFDDEKIDIDDCGSVEVRFYAIGTSQDTVYSNTVTFTVLDNTPPSIDIEAGPLSLNFNQQEDFQQQLVEWLRDRGGARATDNCTPEASLDWLEPVIDLTGVCGTQLVTFKVSDKCGNIGETTTTLTIIDDVPPIVGDDVSLVLYTTSENFDLDIQNWLDQHGGVFASDLYTSNPQNLLWSHNYNFNLDQSTCNSAPFVFTVADRCGNTSNINGLIEVQDTILPTLSPVGPPPPLELSCDGMDQAAFEQALDDWIENNGGTYVADNLATPLDWTYFYRGEILARCSQSFTIHFTVSDPCNKGNSIQLSLDVIMQDNEPPTINPGTNTFVLDENDPVSVDQYFQWASSGGNSILSDNCSEAPFWLEPTSILLSSPGVIPEIHEVSFHASDGCNESSFITTVEYYPYDENPCTGPVISNAGIDLEIPCTCNFSYSDEIDEWLQDTAGISITACTDAPIIMNYSFVDYNQVADCKNPSQALTQTITFTFQQEGYPDIEVVREIRVVDEDCYLSTDVNGGDLDLICGQNNGVAISNWLSNHGGIKVEESCGLVFWEHDSVDQSKVDNCEDQAIQFRWRDECDNQLSETHWIRFECQISVQFDISGGTICPVVEGCPANVSYQWPAGYSTTNNGDCLVPSNDIDRTYNVTVTCGVGGNLSSCTNLVFEVDYNPPCPSNPSVSLDIDNATGKLKALTGVCQYPTYKWYYNNGSNPIWTETATFYQKASFLPLPYQVGTYRVEVEDCISCATFSKTFEWEGSCPDPPSVSIDADPHQLRAVINGQCANPTYQWYSNFRGYHELIGETGAITTYPDQLDETLGTVYTVEVTCTDCPNPAPAEHIWCSGDFVEDYEWAPLTNDPDVFRLEFLLDNYQSCGSSFEKNLSVEPPGVFGADFITASPGEGWLYTAYISIPPGDFTEFDVELDLTCPGSVSSDYELGSCSYNKSVTVQRYGVGHRVAPSSHPFSSKTDVDAINLFPNPATSEINIAFTTVANQDLNIAIFDTSGKLMAASRQASYKGDNLYPFDIRTYPAGVYLVQIQRENGVFNKKFLVVQK